MEGKLAMLRCYIYKSGLSTQSHLGHYRHKIPLSSKNEATDDLDDLPSIIKRDWVLNSCKGIPLGSLLRSLERQRIRERQSRKSYSMSEIFLGAIELHFLSLKILQTTTPSQARTLLQFLSKLSTLNSNIPSIFRHMMSPV